ncbi:MAG: ABC transporter ATP-binding protein [Verrucomicrobiae bacterium]|nr:ABC transporter ATP-binding protein [Verrucomicrobiae bacterium]
MSEYPVRTEHLGKTYSSWFSSRATEALADLTIEVPEGSVFGFLGPNGAGKTTTINMLIGLLKPTRGQAWLMGRSPMDGQAREHVGYMPEVPTVYPHMTAVEFLDMMGQLSHIETTRLKARIDEVISEVGLKGKENIPSIEFSKGMKQRLELAQAILAEPKLLILDEPFSGLDPIGRKDIRDLIVRYNKERKITVFFSSHILADTEIMCDWVGILNHGKLEALGMLEELLEVQNIEISGKNLRPEGMMFIEKMGDHTVKNGDVFSIFLKPNTATERVEQLFHKYGASDVKVKKHCKSLEEFFLQTVKDASLSKDEEAAETT